MSDQGFPAPGGSYPPPPPVGYQPPPMAPSAPVYAAVAPPVVRRGNGQLTAAGILQIIQGALFGIIGLWLFSVTQSDVGGFVDDLSGGSITFAAVLMVGLAVALIWVAVLCIKARKGGWVTTVVFQSIFVFFGVFGVAGAQSEGESVGGAVVVVAYCVITLFLAASGGKQSTR